MTKSEFKNLKIGSGMEVTLNGNKHNLTGVDFSRYEVEIETDRDGKLILTEWVSVEDVERIEVKE